MPKYRNVYITYYIVYMNIAQIFSKKCFSLKKIKRELITIVSCYTVEKKKGEKHRRHMCEPFTKRLKILTI